MMVMKIQTAIGIWEPVADESEDDSEDSNENAMDLNSRSASGSHYKSISSVNTVESAANSKVTHVIRLASSSKPVKFVYK